MMLKLFTLLCCNFFPAAVAYYSNKGPRGLQVLTQRYVLVAEANIDAIVVVDVIEGGVKGVLRLHPADLDPKTKEEGLAYAFPYVKVDDEDWKSPRDVASCLDCDYLYTLSYHHVHINRAQLPTTWRKMIEANDFSPLSEFDGELTSVVLMGGDENMIKKTKQMVMLANGEAFFVHKPSGIWKINKEGEASLFLNHNEIGIGKLHGLHLSHDENFLVASSLQEVATIHVAEAKKAKTEHIFQDGNCNPTEGAMFNMVLAYDNKHAYGFASNAHNDTNKGGAFYKFHLVPSKDDTETPKYCTRIAGDQTKHMSWVDGPGDNARFATHSGAGSVAMLSSENGVDRLISTDTDNHALRLIVVKGYEAEVFTVEYNHDLWSKVYFGQPWVPETNVHPVSLQNTAHTKQFQVEGACKSKGMRQCEVDEVRANADAIMKNEKVNKGRASLTFWTGTPCTSCYLGSPGYCPDLEKQQQSTGVKPVANTDVRDKYSLGLGFYMSSTIHETVHKGKTSYSIENQCLPRSDHLVEVDHAICCNINDDDDNVWREYWIVAVVLGGILFLALLFFVYKYRSNIAGAVLGCCFACSRCCQKKTDGSYDRHKRVTKKLVESALSRSGKSNSSEQDHQVNLMEQGPADRENLQLDPDGEAVWKSQNDETKRRQKQTFV